PSPHLSPRPPAFHPFPTRRSSDLAPGISRRRRGRGFEYLDSEGERIDDPEVLERIAALAIPPAWREVWVCMDPRGHLQATGVDVDRKSTRLNSSHQIISYAVFCLK